MKAAAGRTLNRMNLNLLKVLAEISQVRSVTAAAENLGLSQSAVSHALGQLRGMFNDELFVRSGSGMVPTPFAADIGERLPQALLELENAVAAKRFVAEQATNIFNIGCSDYTMSVFLPCLLKILAAEAPGIGLTIIPLGERLLDRLDMGKLDLVIAGAREIPDRMAHELLFEEQNVWVHRRGHSMKGQPLTAATLASMRIVTVDYGIGVYYDEFASFASRDGLVQWTRTTAGEIAFPGSQRSSANVTVPNFFTAASLVADSDLATQLPVRLAASLAPRFDLEIRADWPADEGGSLAQIWHRAFGNRPAQLWLRGAVRRAADETAE